MSMSSRWPLLAVLPALGVVLLVSGCGKYDALERNMQYISSNLLRKESVVAYERVTAAHAAWKASPGQENLATYKEYYAQYSVIYNELMDRSGRRLGARLGAFSETLPPPPPGMQAKPAAPSAPAASPKAAPPVGGAGPETSRAPATSRIRPISPAVAPAATEVATADAGEVVVRSGDTPHRIAKSLGVSEDRLMEINGITDPSKLSIGTRLRVPAH